jgi:hypothetical protein
MPCGFCGDNLPEDGLNVDGTIQVTEILAYKGLNVVRQSDGTPMLFSPVFGTAWVPGVWATAGCGGEGKTGLYTDPTHPGYHGPGALHADGFPCRERWSPVKTCGCGFYAGRTHAHLIGLGYANYTVDSPSIVAQVELQGKIIPASNGWRAQQMRPRVLYVPFELWELGRDLKATWGPHGVEIQMAATTLVPKTGEQAIPYCVKCGAQMRKRTIRCGFCKHTHT